MMTRFIILSTQRSGSTVLIRTLDEHPDVFCAGEIFHESKANTHHPEWHFPNWKIVGGKGSKLNKAINYPNLKLNAVNHIKKFFSEENGARAKGFKLMYSHIKQAPFVWDYILNNDIKVIVLVRNNVFKMALSRYRMEQTGTAHSSKAITASSIQIPAQALLQQTLQLQGVNEKMLSVSAKANRLILHYEDFTNWSEVMQKVDAFLNVPFIDVQPVLKKVSAEDWRTELSNYKEIEAAFTGSKAMQYLND